MSTPDPIADSGTLDEITVNSAPPSTTSTQQYNRQLSLVVADNKGNGTELNQFRVVFQVQRGDFQNPNTADIRVYNLSTATANKLAGKEFTQLQLQAGYPGNFGTIFIGTIVQARVGRESQTDSYVDFTAADGDEAFNFSTMAISLAADTATASNAVSQFIASMAVAGITQGYMPKLNDNAPARGKVFWGCTFDEIRTFSRQNNVKVSIQDGKLTIIPLNNLIAGAAVVISPNTGLIGIPEQTQNGISVRTLLNPSIKIGQSIKITDAAGNANGINQARLGTAVGSALSNYELKNGAGLQGQGLYYVMVANHHGDTRGNDWYSDLVCLSIDATLVPSSYLAQGAIGTTDSSSESGPVATN